MFLWLAQKSDFNNDLKKKAVKSVNHFLVSFRVPRQWHVISILRCYWGIADLFKLNKSRLFFQCLMILNETFPPRTSHYLMITRLAEQILFCHELHPVSPSCIDMYSDNDRLCFAWGRRHIVCFVFVCVSLSRTVTVWPAKLS